MQPPQDTRRIAIIGSGIAGLTCAHVLGDRVEAVLYESDDRLGGHANTVDVDDPDGSALAIDTGFIVHNRRNYPNFCRLLDELDIDTQPSEMSFSVTDRERNLTYRATNPSTIFADRRNLGRPAMWRMLADIVRFWRASHRLLDDADENLDLPLGGFVARHGFSEAFVEWHLRPMISSIWSADPAGVDDTSAVTLLQFLDNHGLLGLGDRPQWRTIVGGSRSYVEAIERRFDGKIRTDTPVRSVRRRPDGVEVVTDTGRESFDHVILACHTDQSLRLLADPTPTERAVLGNIGYLPNQATLHTDTSVLSPRRRAWASWNYEVDRAANEPRLTYDLTTLQQLPGRHRYLVSLNLDDRIDPSSVIRRISYAHPILDRSAVHAQRRLPEINGVDGVSFCGAWARHGFHEDGMASALDVCERLGVNW